MKYNFKKHLWDGETVMSVDAEKKVLNNLGSWGWTPSQAQDIIDGVEANKQLTPEKDPYVWGNEDVAVFSNINGVLLIDKMAMRAKLESTPLELTHEEFITFMRDFKKFIEENS